MWTQSNVEKAEGAVQSLSEERSVDAKGKLWFHWAKSMPVKKNLRKIQLQVKAMKFVGPSQSTDEAGVPWYHREGHSRNVFSLGKEIKT